MPYNPTPPSYNDPRYQEFLRRLAELGPINTDDRAREYQKLWEEFHETRLSISYP